MCFMLVFLYFHQIWKGLGQRADVWTIHGGCIDCRFMATREALTSMCSSISRPDAYVRHRAPSLFNDIQNTDGLLPVDTFTIRPLLWNWYKITYMLRTIKPVISLFFPLRVLSSALNTDMLRGCPGDGLNVILLCSSVSVWGRPEVVLSIIAFFTIINQSENSDAALWWSMNLPDFLFYAQQLQSEVVD